MCGHHQKRIGQANGLVADGYLPLLHRLEQGRLDLGRGAVDLVGQHQVGEDRPQLLGELRRLHVVDGRAGDVGGQQIGRELQPLEAGVQRLRQGLHRQRLGQARDALDQAVAAGQEPDEYPLDHVALADDGLGQLPGDVVDEGALALHHVVDGSDVLGCLHRAHGLLWAPENKPSAGPGNSAGFPWDSGHLTGASRPAIPEAAP